MKKYPIIDIHCHTAGIGSGSSCFISGKLEHSWKLPFYIRSFGVTRREVETGGDEVIIEKISRQIAASRFIDQAVVLAMDGTVTPEGELDRSATEFYVDNRFVAAGVKKHDNLRWGASINPLRKNALRELDCAIDNGAVLIKWLPNIQRFDPADRRLAPFYQALAAAGMPLLIHTGREASFAGKAHDEFGNPSRLRLALDSGVTVIAAHCASAGHDGPQRCIETLAVLLEQYSNLYTDIAALPQLDRIGKLKEILTSPAFHDRLVHGSDFPLINTPLFTPLQYAPRLSPKKLVMLMRTANPFDRDFLLKRFLGFHANIFTRAATLLRR